MEGQNSLKENIIPTEYMQIRDEAKKDFQFLIDETSGLPSKLNEMLEELKIACMNNSAFYIKNGEGTINTDLNKSYEEINNDVKILKTNLLELYQELINDIDNINNELQGNFGKQDSNLDKKE